MENFPALPASNYEDRNNDCFSFRSICWFFCKITRMAKFVLADIIYGLTKVAFVLGYSHIAQPQCEYQYDKYLRIMKRFQHFWHFCLCLINNALAIVVEHHLIFITDIQPHENRSNMISSIWKKLRPAWRVRDSWRWWCRWSRCSSRGWRAAGRCASPSPGWRRACKDPSSSSSSRSSRSPSWSQSFPG